MPTPDTAVGSHALRTAMGNFPTGVTVVTCCRDGDVRGATVNAFTSVSLDPPLVLVALDRRSRTAARLAEGPYAVNLLAEDQEDLAMHFAGRPRAAPVAWRAATGACPLLAGTVGHLTCRPWTVHDGGDHELHLGVVVDLEIAGTRPLLFHRGTFPRLDEDPEHSPWFTSLDGPALHDVPTGGHR